MLKTTSASASLSSSTSANSHCSYIGIGTGNISLSGWSMSNNITTPYPYTATNLITPNTTGTTLGPWSSYFGSRPTDKLPELIPRILAYRGEKDEIKNLNEIHSVYISICSGITLTNTSTEKNIEKYKALWEISKGNETIWIMYSKHDDNDVSQIANFLILHCH